MRQTLAERFKKSVFAQEGRTERLVLSGFFDKAMFTDLVHACAIAKVDIDYAVECIIARASTRLNNGAKRDVMGFSGFVRPEIKEEWNSAVKENRMKGFLEVNDSLKELLGVKTPDELVKKLAKFKSEYERGKDES